MILPSWPFAVWGVDILGPFPRAVGGYRFLYVTIDKFTKWPEVTPVVNITKKSAAAFLKSIMCKFGVPNRIIADNGTQFKSRLFQEYARTSASSYALRPWHIPAAMDRSRERMQRSLGDSRPAPITA